MKACISSVMIAVCAGPLCGSQVPRSDIELLGLQRRSRPPAAGWRSDKYLPLCGAFGVRVKNDTHDTVRVVKVVYQFRTLEPWTGPGSFPPANWTPREIWQPPRRTYANLVLPPGQSISLIWAIHDWVKGIRIASVELGRRPFREMMSPLEAMALKELAGLPDLDPLRLDALPEAEARRLMTISSSPSFADDLINKKEEIAARIQKEDPRKLSELLFAREVWSNDVTISPLLDAGVLKSLTIEDDPADFADGKWQFEEIPLAVGLEPLPDAVSRERPISPASATATGP